MTNQGPRSTSRREFLKAAAMVGAGAALAACAPAAAPGGAPAAAPAVNTGERQTVRYLSWWFEEGNRGITWNNFIKEFNESQSDIEVVAENIPFDQYTTKTIVGAQSGELDGDILMATPELAPRLIRSDLLAPLDDVLTRNNITDLSSAHDAMRAAPRRLIHAGSEQRPMAHADLFISSMAEDAVFRPIVDWLR